MEVLSVLVLLFSDVDDSDSDEELSLEEEEEEEEEEEPLFRLGHNRPSLPFTRTLKSQTAPIKVNNEKIKLDAIGII